MPGLGYGHFTFMQVRGGRTRGLELHLERLVRATDELFDYSLDHERVRDHVRHAAGAAGAALSLRVSVFSRALAAAEAPVPAEPDLLVTTSAGAEPSFVPLRVRSVEYRRDVPHVKHFGTFGISYHRRRAVRDGFDDALFVDGDGRISEGTIWNVAFFDGRDVVWPSAPALAGIGMLLLRRGLERRGVPWQIRDVRLHDLPSFRSAFLTNSISVGQPIASIDRTEFTVDAELTALLTECYETNPWEPL